jgi:hypothetical protein
LGDTAAAPLRDSQVKVIAASSPGTVVAATGDIYAGLWYPIGVALLTLVLGLLSLPETFRRRIDHEG